MVKKNYIYLFVVFVAVIVVRLFVNQQPDIKEIRLGASLPLSGINQNLGEEVVIGSNIYFNHINAKGGIDGKKIKFIHYDDKYEPEITLTNINKLIKKDKVFALFDFVGTPTVKKVLPLIKKSQIPFIAPYTGASFLRNPKIQNIVNLRSSYKEEIDALVGYLVKNKNLSKFSIFYQNDDYGKEGYKALLSALEVRNLKLQSEGTYKRNTLFIKQAIYDIEQNKPEAIILVGAYKPTARFIKKARKSSLKNVIFCPISFVNADALMSELDNDGKNIIFSQVVPSYSDDTKITREYKKLLNFYYPNHKPTFASFESYLAAKVVVKALEKLNGQINEKDFLYHIKHLNANTLGSIKIKYKNSQLLNRVFLSRFSNGKFQVLQERP
ncbi:MAG: ABC transporter substrate-binding protein [Epsilonproteobacteria bacterium]|nr:ABC transporter substrate-binding protein [Campylobacterota bacterium]